MKKTLIALLSVIAVTAAYSTSMAQSAKKDTTAKKSGSSSYSGSSYKEGEWNANLGVGFGMYGLYGDMVVPPVSISAECNTKSIEKLPLSFGGFFGYASSEDKWTVSGYETGWEFTYIIFGARGSYHFTNLVKSKNVDLYFGILLGYNYVSAEVIGRDYGYSADGSYLMYGGYLGGRYFFNDTIGVFGEIGYGMGYITVGLTAKF